MALDKSEKNAIYFIFLVLIGFGAYNIYQDHMISVKEEEINYLKNNMSQVSYQLQLKEEEINKKENVITNLWNLIWQKDDEIKQYKLEISSLQNNISDMEKIINPSEAVYISTKNINDTHLKEIITQNINKKDTWTWKRVDDEYQLYDIETIQKYFKNLRFKKEYTKEKFDCDDFTMVAMVQMREYFPGMAIGFMSVDDDNEVVENQSVHAINIIVDDDYNVWYSDPQNGEFYLLKEMSKHTKYRDVNYIFI